MKILFLSLLVLLNLSIEAICASWSFPSLYAIPFTSHSSAMLIRSDLIEPSSFCKCTCFSNSTIIELRPIDTDKEFSDGLLKRTAIPAENWAGGSSHNMPALDVRDGANGKDDGSQQTPGRGRALTCNDCNRAFCLDYNLPKCKGAKEEDVIATCFRTPPYASLYERYLL